MSIEHELIQLAETKNLIKNAIIDKGVEVATSLPFRQYADKIAEISGGVSGYAYNVKLRNKGNRTLSDGIYTENEETTNSGIVTRDPYNGLYTSNFWKIVTRFKYIRNNSSVFSTIVSTISDDRHQQDYQGIMFLVSKDGDNFMPHLSTSFGYWNVFNGSSSTTLDNNSIYTLTIQYNSTTGYSLDLLNENTGTHYTQSSPITDHLCHPDGMDTPLSFNYMSYDRSSRIGRNTYYLEDSYIDIGGEVTKLCELYSGGGGELPDELLPVSSYFKSKSVASPSKWTLYCSFKLTEGADGSMFCITTDIDNPTETNTIFFSSAWVGSRFRINKGGDGEGTDYFYNFVGQILYLKVTYENGRLYGGLGLDKTYSQVSIDLSNVPSRANIGFTAKPIWGSAYNYTLINPAETYIINEDTGERLSIGYGGILSGGGGESSTSGDLFNTKSCYLMSIPTEYEGIKGLKIKSNNKTNGRPIYIAGIKPYYFYEGEDPNDLNTRETFKYKSGSSEVNFKFKELIYRQRFVIEDQYDTPHTSIGENEFRAFMVCEDYETSNNPATSLGSYRIYFNTPAISGYYATLYPIYTCNIWRNGDPIHVKVGDIIDVTYEFENDNTLKITTKINDNDAVISYSSSSDASAITTLGNRYIKSNTFGGHTHLNGFGYDKFGINTILLEGTSIYSKVHNKYIWQLFK